MKILQNVSYLIARVEIIQQSTVVEATVLMVCLDFKCGVDCLQSLNVKWYHHKYNDMIINDDQNEKT